MIQFNTVRHVQLLNWKTTFKLSYSGRHLNRYNENHFYIKVLISDLLNFKFISVQGKAVLRDSLCFHVHVYPCCLKP